MLRPAPAHRRPIPTRTIRATPTARNAPRPGHRPRGFALVVAMLLLLAIVLMAGGVALHLSTDMKQGGRWNDRQQTLQTANATLALAQASIKTVLATASSDANVATVVASQPGFYASSASAPAWTPWPTSGVVTVQPFANQPAAQYFVVYEGMSASPITSGTELVGGNGGTNPTPTLHRFTIFVQASGHRPGVQVTLEAVRQLPL